MKINENTKWGEVDKDLEFLDHPAFPKPDQYKTRQKPRVAVMGYNKDDIEPSFNKDSGKWEPEGVVEEPSYTDVIYEELQTAKRKIARLEMELEQTRKNLARMWESKK